MPFLSSVVLIMLAGRGQTDAKTIETRLDGLVAGVVGKTSPGLALIVQKGGQTLYAKASGFADREGKAPLTLDTPMKIASLTKAFTANLIQKLAADGKLGLDDPIGPYFPTVPAWAKVTIRQLLNHVSGVPEHTSDASFGLKMGKPGGPKEILAMVSGKPLDFVPGSKFAYCNTNYILLGLIAEKAGGTPIESQFKARIFEPLGMKRTLLPRKGGATPGEANGSTLDKNGEIVAPMAIDMGWPYAAGSIVASANDMARWIGGIAEAKALTESQRAEAFTPAKLTDGELSFYGFGWILATRGMAPLIAHGGGIPGFSTYVMYLPASDVRVVVLANGEQANVSSLGKPILDAVEGKETIVPIEDKDPKLTKRLRTVVDKMLRGERDADEFAPSFLKAVPTELYAKTGRGLGELGEVEEFTLVKETKSGTNLVREYRFSLGEAPIAAVFTIGADGKISGFNLR